MRLARAGTVVLLAVLAAACDKARTGETVTQDAAANCTRCHGYPPPPNGPFLMPTTTSHPVNSDCHLCHPQTVEADNVTIIPASAGGLHMDGVVEATGGHAAGYGDPAQHGPDALAFLGGSGTLQCTACHGADFAGGSSGKSCNACHTAAAPAPGFADWQTNCTFCHGTKTPGWTDAQLTLAAPPEAVVGSGDQTNANPKVGAHQAHLAQGTYAAALPCESCHVIPAAPTTPLVAGAQHFQGNGAQAALTFSALARQGGAAGTYAGAGGSCAVYCHGSGSGVSGGQNTTPAWTSTGLACDACHGLPPSTGPTIGSPAKPAHAFHVDAGATCADCHLGYTGTGPDPVDRTTHVNGVRDVVVLRASDSAQVTIAGWDCNACHTAKNVPFASHPVPYTTHQTDALAGIAACTGCHGADYGGGLSGLAPSCNACHATQVAASAPDWKTNCTFCHGTRTASVTSATSQAAPPFAVDGSTTASKVGAHQAHLTAGQFSNALPCSTCHLVPADPLGHFAGYAGGQAPITFDALATHYDSTAAYAGTGGSCTAYCHGSGTVGTDSATVKYAWPTGSVAADKSIRWDAATGVTCTSCHGNPPATGQHALHVTSTSGPRLNCATCHNGYTSTTVDKTTHPNGVRDVIVTRSAGGTLRITGWDCTTCHNASPVLY